jgi:hypothetical protein
MCIQYMRITKHNVSNIVDPLIKHIFVKHNDEMNHKLEKTRKLKMLKVLESDRSLKRHTWKSENRKILKIKKLTTK